MNSRGGGIRGAAGSLKSTGYKPAYSKKRLLWLTGALWLASCLSQRAAAQNYKLLSAIHSEALQKDETFQSAQPGRTLSAPWRLRTGEDGRLLLANPVLKLELQPLTEVSLETPALQETQIPVRSFIKPSPTAQKGRPAGAPLISLHRGTLFVEAGLNPVSLKTQQIRIDARCAVFALSTTLASGDLLSVLRGQVKVHHADKTVTFVPAGKCLRTGVGMYPKLGLLSDQFETQEHRRGLSLLVNIQIPGELPSADGEVGGGAQSPFDLRARRSAALLTAPNSPNIGRPDVSPELPNPENPIP